MSRRQRWVLVLTSIASLMVALDVTVVSTALSTIRLHLGASIDELEWTVNAYCAELCGPADDGRGARRPASVAGGCSPPGSGLFVAASAACALAPNVGLLIAARARAGRRRRDGRAAVAGAAERGIPAGAAGLGAGDLRRHHRAGRVGGPVIGGAVTQGLAWQWIFWLNVPIGAGRDPVGARADRESRGPRARLDVRGLAWSPRPRSGSCGALVRGNTAGWGSLEVVGALAGGVALAVAFVLVGAAPPQPMLPMRLFPSRAFSAGNAANFLLFGSLFSAVFFMAQFQQTALGQGPLDAGLRLLPVDRRRCSSSRRSPGRWSTGSASGR